MYNIDGTNLRGQIGIGGKYGLVKAKGRRQEVNPENARRQSTVKPNKKKHIQCRD